MQHLEGLNPAQREAVATTEGALLVLAGAGSGKTRVITHRIVELIHKGVAPHNILAVTFTNKAAAEMRERVLSLMKKFPASERASYDSVPVVTTFHSFGVRTLREFHHTLDLPKHFTIHDRSDSTRAIKAALEGAGYSIKQFEPRRILSMISRAKGDAISRESFTNDAASYPERVAAEVWERYEQILKAEKALDFDDLLVKTYILLRDHSDVRSTLQTRYQYLHVDEYQDTNKIQFHIARLLAEQSGNICVVGDIDQNIYSWRGADIKNVLQFERNFPGAKTILLEENYRSTKTIIAASNDVIAKNRNRVEKNVFTNNADGDNITLYAARDGISEAEYVALTIKDLLKSNVAPSDIAVLYRTNFQSRGLEEIIRNMDIPYQLLGTKFFERKEVKDVMSFLRLALNPESTGDLARIINVPTRGIGKVTALKVIEGKRGELTGATREKVDRFFDILSDIRDTALTEKISETIKFIVARTGLETHYKKSGTEEDLERLENLRELVTSATRFDELDAEEAVEAFLEHAALQSDQDELQEKEIKDAVRLMTVHAAKGLEFPYVFITGLEEGLFPHERLDEKGVDHEEERRLFYVALTRAGKKVFLTYAHMRTIFGTSRINVPSSFLNDIDTAYIDTHSGVGGHDGGEGYETTVWLD